MCESFFVILNGPYLLGLSLAVGCVVLRWVASSQTFCPSLKGLYLVALIVICWACIIACCAGCLIWPGVMCILGKWEPFSPVSLCSVSEYSEVLFQPLVGPFGLSVCLRVVGGADVLFDVQVFTEFPHCSSRKSRVVVRDDLLGEAIVGEYVFAVEFGDSYGIDCFPAWDEYGSF